MDMKLHLLETFAADGADGVMYKVHGYERLARDETIADGQEHWESTGVAEYRLASGELVDMQKDGSMKVVSTGVLLTRH